MKRILLDRNENHYGPAPECLDVVREAESELLSSYTRDFERGHYSELSNRIAEQLGVPERRVVLGYGCEDVLKQAVHHYVRAGDTVFVPSASWWYYNAIAGEV